MHINDGDHSPGLTGSAHGVRAGKRVARPDDHLLVVAGVKRHHGIDNAARRRATEGIGRPTRGNDVHVDAELFGMVTFVPHCDVDFLCLRRLD
jgi:hypothetical protein